MVTGGRPAGARGRPANEGMGRAALMARLAPAPGRLEDEERVWASALIAVQAERVQARTKNRFMMGLLWGTDDGVDTSFASFWRIHREGRSAPRGDSEIFSQVA